METFGYLQTAEEFESSDSRELVCVQNDLNLPSVPELKVSGQMMAVVAGTAGAAAVLGLSAGEAQAFPVGLGDSGPDVTYVQNLLSDAGYFSGTATGYFGGVTQNAVINFQADNGLVADGIVGSATLSELEFRPVNPGGGGSGVLSFGSSGSEVSRLQNLLNDAGYFVPVTGYFGPQTENAVINFQSAYGLSADGIAGPATFAALEGFVPINPGTGSGTVRFGDSGARVTELQNLLRSAGFFFGSSTGFFGSVTEDAVIRFQRSSGLAVDGVAGPATFAALQGGFVPVNPDDEIANTRILRRGDSGSAVVGLQQQLINRGFLAPGLDTGFFGSATEAALIAYQRSVGLVADGVFGPATAVSFV